MPQNAGYLGTFSLDSVVETGGAGSVAWHFTVDNADIQFLAQGQSITQTYEVAVTDEFGASTVQDVNVTLNGTNDAPTAVSENVITDVAANGAVVIPNWALAANDTDPDTIDHLFVNNILSSSGGSAVLIRRRSLHRRRDTRRFVHLHHVGRHCHEQQCGHRDRDQQCLINHGTHRNQRR